MVNTSTKPRYWTGKQPSDVCQFSGVPITTEFVDGHDPGVSTRGIYHPDEFKRRGGVFGTGHGQLYERQADGRWLKVEG